MPRSAASSLVFGGLLAAAVLALAPAPAQAAHILVVSDAGGDLGIADVLRGDGHQVVVVTNEFTSGYPTLRADLSSYDAIFWSANGGGYGDVHSDTVVFANLEEFVRHGGRVLVTGYDSVASPSDGPLIAFLGASGSTDVPPPPGPIAPVACSLTIGRVDLRGVTPLPASSDRDTLTGLGGDTIEIAGTSGGGSGGAQWTLRRLGQGEIAYVSNGDPGAASTSGWTNAAADGSGAYRGALLNFAAASARAHASAEPAHRSPRRAHAMYLMRDIQPAVLVGPDRAWIPPGTETPLAICAGPRCHPVRETRSCAPPECPGEGLLVVAIEHVADVPEMPRDRQGFGRECASLLADPVLAPLGERFGVHPEPPPPPPEPVRFRRRERDWLGWELGLMGGIGGLGHSGVAVGTGTASLGLRFQAHLDEGLDVMYGTQLGFDVRATVLPQVHGQGSDDLALLVGVAPAFSYAFPRDRVRIPPAWAWVMPGFGVAVRTDRAPTYYVDWHLESAVLLDEHVGVDARLDVVLLDEWVEGDDVEALISLGVGFFFR